MGARREVRSRSTLRRMLGWEASSEESSESLPSSSASSSCKAGVSSLLAPDLGLGKQKNRSMTISCSNRLGKADRLMVTAATTPAHRSWAMVVECSISSGSFSRFGFMHRMYRVRVSPILVMRDESWVRNLVHTVCDTKEPVLALRVFDPVRGGVRPPRRPVGFGPALAAPDDRALWASNFCKISCLINSLLHSLQQSAKSAGKLSVFFFTKFVESYVTGPA
mmetsp:Transcript_37818/g.55695  ORF Transcript_37818/g.55695 Transcript_37818/m.55695 type:complete len:222 (-) Transcript_37818:2203-2868(-)